MNILQISPRVPFPPIDGGKRGILNITKPLAERGHHITLIALSRHTENNWSELERYCSLQVFYNNSEDSVWKVLRNLFSTTPYTVSKYHNANIIEKILRIIEQGNYDLVHVDTVHCAYYGALIKQRYNLPIVLRAHDYLTAMMERYSNCERNIALKLFSKLQVQKLRSYEGAVCLKFDRCMMVSKDDEEKLKKVAPTVKTVVIPPSVDTSYFTPHENIPEPYSILWLGALSWLPNIDSLTWFVKKIFPLILRRCPSATLYVVGSGKINESKFIFPPRVKFIGFVEDIRESISKCAVAVVPLRIGSGVRLKLIELFAMGKPVVSTTLGAEGTGAKHGEHLLLADSEEDFASSVLQLLNDTALKERLSQKAREFAVNNFDCYILAEKIEKEYLSLLK